MKATTTAASATTQEEDSKVKSMIQACSGGNLHIVQQLLTENSAYYASQQDVETGRSPLMAAAAVGNEALCQHLLEAGAPWNAVDRQGQCAGNYATLQEHWGVVNLLVEWGTRAELILGMVERNNRQQGEERYSKSYDDGGDDDTIGMDVDHSSTTTSSRTVEHEPSTKPFYLRQRLHYTADGQSLLDSDKDAVMMEWERPLMNAHAKILMDGIGKRVMNIGFGMGIIDSALQEFNPDLHIIIEAHPDVYKKMLADGWDKKQNVRICFGKWQDWVPKLLAEEVTVDGIFFDTYAEHYLDLEDFHSQMVNMLSKPHGRYSFFNGLVPDNIFFHGVACQCVKLQLGQLGLDCEFLPCEIQVKDKVWEGIRRKYWHGRDTYYLPRATWNPQFLRTGMPRQEDLVEEARRKKDAMQSGMEVESDGKRQRVV